MPDRKNEARWIESRSRWQINVQAEGVRRTFTDSTPGTKGKVAAEKKADKWLEHQLVGEGTRCEIMLDRFYDHKKATTSKANYEQLEYYIRVYIKPVIGKKRIGRITEADLQAVIDNAFSAGLAHKTLSNIRATINAFMKYCRRAKTAVLFPEGLEIPKGAKRSEKKIAQPNDLKTLFSDSTTKRYGKVGEDWYIHAYRFAVITGLRPGELLGLQWGDIDGDRVKIRRAVNDDGDITEGKNENARRPISVKGLARKELDAQKEMLAQAGILSTFVFPDPYAEFTQQKRFRRAWERYCEYHGLSKTTPYELRHTYVSLNDEMPDGLKKQALGHSENMDTEGVYGHVKAGDLDRIAAYSDAAILKVINGK